MALPDPADRLGIARARHNPIAYAQRLDDALAVCSADAGAAPEAGTLDPSTAVAVTRELQLGIACKLQRAVKTRINGLGAQDVVSCDVARRDFGEVDRVPEMKVADRAAELRVMLNENRGIGGTECD